MRKAHLLYEHTCTSSPNWEEEHLEFTLALSVQTDLSNFKTFYLHITASCDTIITGRMKPQLVHLASIRALVYTASIRLSPLSPLRSRSLLYYFPFKYHACSCKTLFDQALSYEANAMSWIVYVK